MSSIGQAVGGVVGAFVGFWVGGPAGAVQGAALGMGIGGYIDPPKGPMIRGPRLSDLSVQTSTYGAYIPRIRGSVATQGNIFWIEGDKLKEVAKKEQQGGKGGGGATVKTYSYFATFALGLCEGPIAGVRRIWVGSKLIYDAGSSDMDSVIASNRAAESFAVYLGTEDQQPDPRMQADKGAANVPAYRGLAYIVFYDLPLADHGNSLMGAQVKVEVVSALSSDIIAFRDITAPSIVPPVTVAGSQYQYAMLPFDEYGAANVIKQSGTSGFSYPVFLRKITDTGSTFVRLDDFVTAFGGATNPYTGLAYDTNYNIVPLTNNAMLHTLECIYESVYYTANNPVFIAWTQKGQATRLDLSLYTLKTDLQAAEYDGELWFRSASTIFQSETISFSGLSGGALGIYNGAPCVTSVSAMANAAGVGGTLSFTAYDATGNTTKTASIVFTQDAVGFGFSVGPDSAVPFVDGDLLYLVYLSHIGSGGKAKTMVCLLFDLSTDTFVGQTNIPADAIYVATEPDYPNVTVRDGIIHTCLCITNTTAATHLLSFSLRRITPGLVELADVVRDEVMASGIIETADIDVAALTSDVRGYRVAQTGAIRGAIDPLQAAWPFDVVQSGYQIEFKPRGGASVATIPATLLDARAAGDAPGVELRVSREMDSQLPRRVSIKHLDAGREYDNGEQFAERINTDAVNIRDMELPIVLTAGEAAQKAETLLYLFWLERSDVAFRLPPQYLGLEPADVVTITTEDATYELRLVDVSYLPDGRLECRATYNSQAIYTSTATGDTGSVTGGTVSLPGLSTYQLLDIPAVIAEMDRPCMLAAMTGFSAGWPGAILFRSADGGQIWSDVQAWSGQCTMGITRAPIGTGIYTRIDAASVLQVDLIAGSLSSVSEAAMLNGANHFAYGVDGRWEILAAMTCELQADGSYTLRDMLRGRFGSDWARSMHEAGDWLVWLNDTDVALIGMDTASIGLERHYRGVTAGQPIDSDFDRAMTYRGVNLECLAPVYLNGHRHPTTRDWTLSWIRRTRVGGEWRDYVDASLGEASEAYEVEIYSSSTYATLRRTIAVTSAAATYTSAQQVTDFGSNQATLYLRIYQLSATVGRGYPLETSITGG